MSSSEAFKKTLTKLVVGTTSIEKGKKSTGLKIGTIVKDIETVNVAPFSK